ncbi:uncharacterized protein Dana_GF27012, isoform B [Drosophila ananassae]|uniref:Uncharacterized protein, isoform B n=1 Tax=Drosophila ananassae TaxID=7217 RepID=A0A0P9BNE5_DROAN|nr:uncharacterized protein LOC26514421 isoform X2 [Drosophila ananassae]KPU73369.1 uncharacterized protein Dana_GF27012, isoform B [Drosophila ananassae]
MELVKRAMQILHLQPKPGICQGYWICEQFVFACEQIWKTYDDLYGKELSILVMIGVSTMLNAIMIYWMTEAQRVQDLQYELSRELVETRLQMAEALDRRIAQGYRMRLRRNPEPDGADEDGEELERAVEKFLETLDIYTAHAEWDLDTENGSDEETDLEKEKKPGPPAEEPQRIPRRGVSRIPVPINPTTPMPKPRPYPKK